jgi:chromosome partitioning protein
VGGGWAEDGGNVKTSEIEPSPAGSVAPALWVAPPVPLRALRPGPRLRVVFNQKGGVGKTTLATNLATCAALAGQRTLLVDADPNANATAHVLGPTQPPARTLAHFFDSCLGLTIFAPSVAEYITPATRVPGLQLLAGDRRLDDLRPKLESRHKINKLRDGLADVSFDQVYFDTPPTLDFFSLSCLIAAHELIVPVDCDAFSVAAAQEVRRAVDEVRQDHNQQLIIAGVVINHFQRSTRHATRVVSELRRLGFRVLEPYIPASVKVRESHSESAPLVVRHAEHPVGIAMKGVYEALS